ncbi:hypothetical protein M409DRAFT_19444 [Zasmidium cellare ATCC 36951]|uniref:Amidohydrolase-related domain-containing protein n=1 Tax=Zasmidium cellare ATCC 36951 TaxID=1080233 RepID=A0A6A6CWP8_ZASCE|nr:uncharacterized protein M409DRAFT_19444 [Zasmidium cellare ATCC 36951]KAF2170628.1 hypothetical protein M409DRAFT_19444 [Zasmidium cellare ATCC 36951]
MASFLVKDVRIFDGDAVIDRGSVLVKDGKIAKVSTTPIDFDGKIVSKPGHTLLPGLIDAHVHIDFGSESGLAQGLRFGVTTQCDMGNAPFQIHQLRALVSKGDCSDLKAAMKSATPEGGWPAPLLEKAGVVLPPDENTLQTVEEGHNFVRDQVKDGADYIKILHESGAPFAMDLPRMPTSVVNAITDEAHTAGLTTLAHAFTIRDTLEVLSLGVDGTAHVAFDKPPTNELIEAFRKNDSFCIPTLTVIGSCTAESRSMQEGYAHDARVKRLLVEGGQEKLCQCSAMTSANDGSLRNGVETVRRLKDAGIDIICGTDSTGLAPGTAYGLSLHQELELYVKECGFSPIEALRSATSLPAKRLKFPDRGWIREGMRADLVLVEGNPIEDIHHTLELRGAWVAGELCAYYEDRL